MHYLMLKDRHHNGFHVEYPSALNLTGTSHTMMQHWQNRLESLLASIVSQLQRKEPIILMKQMMLENLWLI